MTDKLSHEKLTAYIRGELSDEESRLIERILDEDPAARNTLAELRAGHPSIPDGVRYSSLSPDSWNPPSPTGQTAAAGEVNIVFACPNCRAKYSIAREKVRGKAFRVICKKCGESIIIKGDTPSAPIRAAVPFPITPSQMPPPAQPSPASSAPIPLLGREKSPTKSGMFDGDRSGAGSGPGLFDDLSESAPSAPGLFDAGAGQQPPSWDGEDHEETPAPGGEAEESSSDTVVTTNPYYEPPPPEPAPTGPRVSAASMLTAARNENSVLFSLSSLKSLAAEAQGMKRITAEPLPAPPQNLGGRTTANRESETSGLIDIRALSGALRAERTAADKADDIIAFSAPAPMAPVLTARSQSGMGLAAKVVVFSAVLGVLISGVVLAVIITMSKEGKKSDEAYLALQAKIEALQKAAASAPATPAKAVAAAPAASPVASAPAVTAVPEPVEADKPAAEAPAPEKAGEAAAQAPAAPSVTKGAIAPQKKVAAAAPAAGSPGPKGSPAQKPAEMPQEPAAKSADQPAPEPAQPGPPPEAKPVAPQAPPAPSKKGTDDLDNLLNPGVVQKKPPAEPPPAAAPETASGAASGVKEKLSREEVVAGMNAIAARIKDCGQGQTGTITLKMVIAKTGRVQSASPIGAFAGTPVGDCAAREARAASFPVSQSDLAVKYPFTL